MKHPYDEVFGELKEEKRNKMIKQDIPVPIVVGEKEITLEQKQRADKFLKDLFGDDKIQKREEK